MKQDQLFPPCCMSHLLQLFSALSPLSHIHTTCQVPSREHSPPGVVSLLMSRDSKCPLFALSVMRICHWALFALVSSRVSGPFIGAAQHTRYYTGQEKEVKVKDSTTEKDLFGMELHFHGLLGAVGSQSTKSVCTVPTLEDGRAFNPRHGHQRGYKTAACQYDHSPSSQGSSVWQWTIADGRR